jgi:hypothetical protein
MGFLVLRSSVTAGGGGGDWWAEGQLNDGEFIPSKLTPQVNYPRPDAETAATDFHRNAFHDGSAGMKYHIMPAIHGGAHPWMFRLRSGPSWLSMPYQFYRGVDANIDTLPYGYIEGTPTAQGTHTVIIDARDQEGNELTIEYELVVGSSAFLFVSKDSGNDSNDGTIGSPFQTAAKVFGASDAATTYPDKIVVLRSAATDYALTAHASGEIQWNGARKPKAVISYPGETVTFDMTNANFRPDNNPGMYFGCGDLTGPLRTRGTCLIQPDAYVFRVEATNMNRVKFHGVDFIDPISQTDGPDTNSTSIFTPFNVTPRQYWSISCCTESGRTRVGIANNNMLGACLFSISKLVVQFCNFVCETEDEYTQGLTLKDTIRDSSILWTRSAPACVTIDGAGVAMPIMYQNGGGNGECVGCVVTGGRIDLCSQASMTYGTGHYVSRCTVYANDFQQLYAIRGVHEPGTGRVFESYDCVLVGRLGSVTTNVDDTGSISYIWNGDGTPGGTNTPIDPTTGRLRNITSGTQYRTLYEATSTPKGHVYRVAAA